MMINRQDICKKIMSLTLYFIDFYINCNKI